MVHFFAKQVDLTRTQELAFVHLSQKQNAVEQIYESDQYHLKLWFKRADHEGKLLG